jgi:Abnormal spindle-like microcephaly-assoc'd, ASPM-SPD-2-Hydin
VILRCLERDPAKRFTEVQDVSAALTRAASGVDDAKHQEGRLARGEISGIEQQTRVLEAAAPQESAVGRSTEVMAMVRQTDSRGLRQYLDEEATRSLKSEDVRERPFALDFPIDPQGKALPAEICLRLDSPDFEPRCQTKKLRVPAKGDSAACSFFIKPVIVGDLVANLELLKGDEVVVSRSIRTRALGEGASVREGVNIISIPLTIFVRDSTAHAFAPPVAPAPHWTKVKASFRDALELNSNARLAFLRDKCPDAEVRAEVERLLAERDQAGGFLSTAALLNPTSPAPETTGGVLDHKPVAVTEPFHSELKAAPLSKSRKSVWLESGAVFLVALAAFSAMLMFRRQPRPKAYAAPASSKLPSPSVEPNATLQNPQNSPSNPSLRASKALPVLNADAAESAAEKTALASAKAGPIQLGSMNVDFGNWPVGTRSGTKVKLTNTGAIAVAIRSISINDNNTGDFAETNTCGGTVAAGASCLITVTFAPSAKGDRAATILCTYGDGSQEKVRLSGTGV